MFGTPPNAPCSAGPRNQARTDGLGAAPLATRALMPSATSRLTPVQREHAQTQPPTCSAASLKRKRAAEPETAELPPRAPAHRARCALASQSAPCPAPASLPCCVLANEAVATVGERRPPASGCVLRPGSREETARPSQVLPPAFSSSAVDGTLRAPWCILSKLFCAKAKALCKGSAGPGRRNVAGKVGGGAGPGPLGATYALNTRSQLFGVNQSSRAAVGFQGGTQENRKNRREQAELENGVRPRRLVDC